MIKRYFSALVICLLLSGCMTIEPTTRQLQTSHATSAATVGAVGGALIGALTGHSGNGVLLGASLGALAGGLVGNAIDQEEAALRQRLDCTGVRVIRCGNEIKLIMPCDITFNNNSAQICEDFFETFDSVALVLQRYNGTLIKIAGFTSNTGSVMHNQVLSENRARSVADYLVCAGINPSRIVTTGYGVRYPVASNDTPSGQALNRRVEITLRCVGE